MRDYESAIQTDIPTHPLAVCRSSVHQMSENWVETGEPTRKVRQENCSNPFEPSELCMVKPCPICSLNTSQNITVKISQHSDRAENTILENKCSFKKILGSNLLSNTVNSHHMVTSVTII